MPSPLHSRQRWKDLLSKAGPSKKQETLSNKQLKKVLEAWLKW
jgi:hypothetical protein